MSRHVVMIIIIIQIILLFHLLQGLFPHALCYFLHYLRHFFLSSFSVNLHCVLSTLTLTIIIVFTVEPVHSGHPRDHQKWLLAQVKMHAIDSILLCHLAITERWPAYTVTVIYRLHCTTHPESFLIKANFTCT